MIEVGSAQQRDGKALGQVNGRSENIFDEDDVRADLLVLLEKLVRREKSKRGHAANAAPRKARSEGCRPKALQSSSYWRTSQKQIWVRIVPHALVLEYLLGIFNPGAEPRNET